MANSIEFAKNYTWILDEVYQRAAVSRCLNSGGRMVRAGRNAKEILIPKISVTGLGDYTRNVGYKTGSITYEYETHSFGYDRAIRLFADVMDVEESGVLDCFVEAGAVPTVFWFDRFDERIGILPVVGELVHRGTQRRGHARVRVPRGSDEGRPVALAGRWLPARARGGSHR